MQFVAVNRTSGRWLIVLRQQPPPPPRNVRWRRRETAGNVTAQGSTTTWIANLINSTMTPSLPAVCWPLGGCSISMVEVDCGAPFCWCLVFSWEWAPCVNRLSAKPTHSECVQYAATQYDMSFSLGKQATRQTDTSYATLWIFHGTLDWSRR